MYNPRLTDLQRPEPFILQLTHLSVFLQIMHLLIQDKGPSRHPVSSPNTHTHTHHCLSAFHGAKLCPVLQPGKEHSQCERMTAWGLFLSPKVRLREEDTGPPEEHPFAQYPQVVMNTPGILGLLPLD